MRLLGYVTSRSFQGITIPVPAQNSCLREFAASNKLDYVLPPLEHNFDNCYMQLFTVVKSLKEGDIIGMYSAGMLPKNDKKLNFLFNEIIKNKNSIFCILESKRLFNLNQAKDLIVSYKLKDIFDDMYQIDLNSLRNLIG